MCRDHQRYCAIVWPGVHLTNALTPLGCCFTPEVARHLVELHASADVQARLESLTDKSTAGQLSVEEHAEYATAIAVFESVSASCKRRPAACCAHPAHNRHGNAPPDA